MSVVTAITIQLSCAEGFYEDRAEDSEPKNVIAVRKWIAENYQYGTCVNLKAKLEDSFGGNKYPQCNVWGAGFNYFPDDDFIEFWKTLEWELPENAILILQPEDGYTKVFRGKDELGEL